MGIFRRFLCLVIPLGPMQQKLGGAGCPTSLLAGSPASVSKATHIFGCNDGHQGLGWVLGNLLGHQLGGIGLSSVELVAERQDGNISEALAEFALLGHQKASDVVVETRRVGHGTAKLHF